MPYHPEHKLLTQFTARLKADITRYLPRERTFGFEYEFIGRHPVTEKMFAKLNEHIQDRGYPESKRGFECQSGLFFLFEPGGQIEFGTPPLAGDDQASLKAILTEMRAIKKEIEEILGMDFLSTGFLPNRANAPLLLKVPRYIAMQQHLSQKGRRGLEMMKGTASIHLHAAIDSWEKLPELFERVCRLSAEPEFSMSPVRRDIWDNTDATRSGRTPCMIPTGDPETWLKAYVAAVLAADDLTTSRPFGQTPDITYADFLNHMSTMFWDVRLNLKGCTIEMRTLDSVPPEKFVPKWIAFTQSLSQ